MKKGILALSVVTIAFLTWSATCEKKDKAEPELIKILSYNVKNCIGMDGVVNYRRVADVIKRVNPDIVALQELDSATQRSKGIVVLSELAGMTGMYQTYGASIDYQGGKYGIGILTKEKPVSWKRIPLPGKEEPRSLLIVELDKIVIACTHFSLTEDDRLSSANKVSAAFKNYSKPVFLAGDLNALPESTVIKNIENFWSILNNTSVPTIPSNNPNRCIDYILGLKNPGIIYSTLKTLVEQEPVASDHLPVWVEVEIKSN